MPALDAVAWGVKNLFWVAVLLASVWYWQKGHQIIAARVAAHRSGVNLGR